MTAQTIFQKFNKTETMINIDDLLFNPYNCNRMDNETLEKLEREVKSNNYDAILVMPQDKEGKYMVLDGEHRTKCAKKLGMEHIRAIIHNIDFNDALPYYYKRQALHGAIDPFKQSELFNYEKSRGLTSEEIGTKYNVSPQTVRIRQLLVKISETVKRQYYEGSISLSHVEELISLEEEDQKLLSAVTIGKSLAVSEMVKYKKGRRKTIDLYPFKMEIHIKSNYTLKNIEKEKLSKHIKNFLEQNNHQEAIIYVK